MKDVLPNALKQIIKFLEDCEQELGIQYYLVGGILVNIYATIRATQDIDFVVDIQSKNISIEDFVALLEKNDFQPFQDWRSSILLARDTKLLQYFDKEEIVKFDNYIIDKFDRSKYKRIGPIALKRRVREKLFGVECWVASKEDFILSKLVFGGWQDYTDSLGCWMRFKEILDVNYLDKTSKELGILRELSLLKSGIEDPDEYFEEINDY